MHTRAHTCTHTHTPHIHTTAPTPKPHLIQGKSLGESKAPASFERTANHGAAGGGWCTGQTEGVGELEGADLHAHIHAVNRSEEVRQTRFGRNCLPAQALRQNKKNNNKEDF